jgi:hypothetical protein
MNQIPVVVVVSVGRVGEDHIDGFEVRQDVAGITKE